MRTQFAAVEGDCDMWFSRIPLFFPCKFIAFSVRLHVCIWWLSDSDKCPFLWVWVCNLWIMHSSLPLRNRRIYDWFIAHMCVLSSIRTRSPNTISLCILSKIEIWFAIKIFLWIDLSRPTPSIMSMVRCLCAHSIYRGRPLFIIFAFISILKSVSNMMGANAQWCAYGDDRNVQREKIATEPNHLYIFWWVVSQHESIRKVLLNRHGHRCGSIGGGTISHLLTHISAI